VGLNFELMAKLKIKATRKITFEREIETETGYPLDEEQIEDLKKNDGKEILKYSAKTQETYEDLHELFGDNPDWYIKSQGDFTELKVKEMAENEASTSNSDND
jgi:hypothetical protein